MIYTKITYYHLTTTYYLCEYKSFLHIMFMQIIVFMYKFFSMYQFYCVLLLDVYNVFICINVIVFWSPHQ